MELPGLDYLHLVSLIFSENKTPPTKKICLNWSLKVQRKFFFLFLHKNNFFISSAENMTITTIKGSHSIAQIKSFSKMLSVLFKVKK
jgi:hypothetical protein